MASRFIDKSLQTIDSTSWTVGDKLILSHHNSAPTNSLATWPDTADSFYHPSLPNDSLPDPNTLSSELQFPLVYDVACDLRLTYGHAVWKVGKAYIKITAVTEPQATREHVTIDFVRNMNPSFEIPRVLYHGEWDGRYYIVLSEVSGKMLNVAWPHMSVEERDACAIRVAEICEELAMVRGDSIAGADGRFLGDEWLRGALEVQDKDDFSHETMLRSCEALRMDCASLVFQHVDMGPGNILIDRENGNAVGVIDWGHAGFAPRDWIRTKFRMCPAMSFDPPVEGDERHDYAMRVVGKLGDLGYNEMAERYRDSRE